MGRIGSQAVVHVNGSHFKRGSDGQGHQSQRVSPSRNGTGNRGSSCRKKTTREEIRDERIMHPTGGRSRVGNGSALVVAAPLALTRKTGGGDLLDVSPTKGSHREDADNRQHDANPPVPNVCCEHGSMVVTSPGCGLVTR